MLRQFLSCNFFILTFFSLSALLSNAIAASAKLSEPTIITLENATSVEQAVSDISTTLESQGFDISLTLDHSANASTVALELAPTVVIFARLPTFAEKLLLRKGATIALDLPIKFLVFEQDNEIRLATNSVGYFVSRHSLKTKDRLLNVIDKLQNQFGEQADGLVTLQSAQSVADTAQTIQDVLIATGTFRTPLVIDFGDRRFVKYRSYQKQKTEPILIVFGNPSVGTPLMQEQQSIGIDLPQKFLVWEDDSGNVNITYNDPFALAKRHSIEGQDARLENISNALHNFARMGAGL